MNKLKTALAFFSCLLSSFVFSQESMTLDCEADAYVSFNAPSTTYGGSTVLYSYHVNNGFFTNTMRSFVKFNLDSIPDNAIISNAYVTFRQLAHYSSDNLLLSMVGASWIESGFFGIKWSNQPIVSATDTVIISSPANQNTHNFTITSFVQKWIEAGNPNYGFRIAMSNESGTTSGRGKQFASREHGTTSYRPTLTVEYYLPIDFNGTVTHCSEGTANDGVVSLHSIVEGTGANTIKWYNSSGTQIGSTNDTIQDGLSPGVYAVVITDDTLTKCNRLKYFLVGRECDETNVTLQFYETFMNDIWSASNIPYTNYEPIHALYAGALTGQVKNSQFRYEFGGLENILADSAIIVLKRHYHTGFGSEDSLFLERKNFFWNESTATYTILENQETATISKIPLIQAPTYTWTGNVLGDFTNYINDPSVFFNYKLTLKNIAPIASPCGYGVKSSYNSTISIRPKFYISFRVDTDCEKDAYAKSKEQHDAGFYVAENGKFRFVYKKEYESQNLNFKIYDWDNDLFADETDFELPPTVIGENYIELNLISNEGSVCFEEGVYTMEITNEKGEVEVLRFVQNTNICP